LPEEPEKAEDTKQLGKFEENNPMKERRRKRRSTPCPVAPWFASGSPDCPISGCPRSRRRPKTPSSRESLKRIIL
jgi:hypothetical protein